MKLPNSYYNTISFFGSMIAGFALVAIALMFVIASFFYDGSPYIGLVIYMVLPAFLIIGLIMIPVGMALKIRREKRENKEDTRWKIINLNHRPTRNAMIIFVMGTFFLMFISTFGGYQAFHFTESNTFCGELCHSVMGPEYTAYDGSAHAHVKCVECHVGEGADWYVKAKISGLRQVWGVLSNNHERPISAPVHNLRPARETCEKCHWPDKFFPNRLIHTRSYLADEENSEWNVTLKMKTGPSMKTMEYNEGIHWHINKNVNIVYKSSPNREDIPWVKYYNEATGDSIIFINTDSSPEQYDSLELRVMDCMDCHNRPSHVFLSPSDFVDFAFNEKTIPKDIPYFKLSAMIIIKPPFPSTADSALAMIEEKMLERYETKYPDVFNNQREKLDQAIDGLQVAFSKNCFPEMKVFHTEYPNHIGHMSVLGCFRCHDNKHQSESGKVISKDCNLCHTIMSQGRGDDMQVTSVESDTLIFWHPEDIGDEWKETSCIECHSDLY